MTSMPASRRVRAMIFAPRSWPSRPGLATTTRILRDPGFSAAVSCVACMESEGRPPAPTRRAKPRHCTPGSLFGGFCRGRGLELPLGELRPQDLLVELAHARLRDRLDEGELVREPPLGDQRLQVGAQLVGR